MVDGAQPKQDEPVYVTNDEDSEDFKLVIETGSSRLLGPVEFTPSIEAEGIQSYEFTIDPPRLSTGDCRDDCSITFKVVLCYSLAFQLKLCSEHAVEYEDHVPLNRI